jgi:probable rRNA maturation factor
MAESLFAETNLQIRIPLKYRFYVSQSQVLNTLALCRNNLGQKDIYDLSVIFTNNEKIQAINKKYRKIDKPTDVLTFPMETVDPESGRINLGDIFISVPKAKSQARELNHPVNAELAVLIIHGYLHLNGFDHDTEPKKKKMWSVQDQIFSLVMASNNK